MRRVPIILLMFCGVAAAGAYEWTAPSAITQINVSSGVISLDALDILSPRGLIRMARAEFWSLDARRHNIIRIVSPDTVDVVAELSDNARDFAFAEHLDRWGIAQVVGSSARRAVAVLDITSNTVRSFFAFADLWGDDDDRRARSGYRGDYLIVAETLFYRDAERKVRAISPEGDLLSHEETLVLMDTVAGDPEETYATLPRVIEQRNRELRETGEHYVIGGRYYTTEWDELKEYYDSIRGARNWTESGNNVLNYWEVASTLPLVGYDEQFNSYWGGGNVVDVLSPTGETLGVFSLVEIARENPLFGVSGWSLDPDGTVWALAFTQDRPYSRNGTLYLYRFDSIADTGAPMPEREPAYEPDATITIPATAVSWGIRQPSVVIVRRQPDRSAAESGQIEVRTPVELLDQTEPRRIGILTAPWYRVATAEGTEGWVYGIFLEMEE